MREHTGDMFGPCPRCGKKFNSKGNLKKHIKSRHKSCLLKQQQRMVVSAHVVENPDFLHSASRSTLLGIIENQRKELEILRRNQVVIDSVKGKEENTNGTSARTIMQTQTQTQTQNQSNQCSSSASTDQINTSDPSFSSSEIYRLLGLGNNEKALNSDEISLVKEEMMSEDDEDVEVCVV